MAHKKLSAIKDERRVKQTQEARRQKDETAENTFT